ncbi:uncharacterized protein LOC125649483 [Ostrea edulis]|uniref:uncharacterized protein LOC125649483 n=1 Tax=Ostrea edulis TaxID=37623 RepID=UPI0020945783|nr:uncharacterized protein LOC125649483 [Ostrea edulis]
MGKLYDLLIQPFVNYTEGKAGPQRETLWSIQRAQRAGGGSAGDPQQKEECYTCKAVVIAILTMYGTAILAIPKTEKYQQSMKKYLRDKNTVLAIFAVHSFFGCGCFVAALYQTYKLKEMLDRRKLQ